MELLCRQAREADRAAALQAAARACLTVPEAQRGWASLHDETAAVPGDVGCSPAFPYGFELPVELAGQVCGTVGLAAAEPVNGRAHRRAATIAELLSTWEARRCLAESPSHQTIVGCSAEMRRVEMLAQRFACLEEPVLIEGETGVGKELIARTIHCLGSRKAEALWTINCAAVPEELLVSELFGHRRGAVRSQRGRLEIADGATLVLDEVGDMGPQLQAALLRVIEYGEIQQLGDEGRGRRIDIRVIAATNRDLGAEVAAGRFRSDLYYRLSPLTIRVPALRERLEDIPLLARYFIGCLEARWDQSLELVDNAVQQLLSYPFPGNVRELRNLILRAAATCAEGRIEGLSLPDSLLPVRPDHLLSVVSGNGKVAVAGGAGPAAATGRQQGEGRPKGAGNRS
ncbi:MAG: sigma 54-interacting transcriptional regulator, partial [Acidobacteriota bacterium]